MNRGPSGVTLVEVLILLLLGMVVVSMGWRLRARQSTVAANLVHQMEVLVARRIAEIVLGRELRAGVSGRDWAAPQGDSLALRAFRGWAPICGQGPGLGTVIVSYHGGRAPNPVRDSLLLLTGGGWRRAHLVDRRSSDGPCLLEDEGGAELWTIDPPISGRLVARLFEQGSYHVSGGALRYRRGLGGRQPLTAAVFDDEGSSMGGSDVRVQLELIDEEALQSGDPLHGNSKSVGNAGGICQPDTHLSFVGSGDRTIDIIDTFHFNRSGQIYIKDVPAGPLQAVLPFPEDNVGLTCAVTSIVDDVGATIGQAVQIYLGRDFNTPHSTIGGPTEDSCIVIKLVGITDRKGVVVVDVRKSDVLPFHLTRN